MTTSSKRLQNLKTRRFDPQKNLYLLNEQRLAKADSLTKSEKEENREYLKEAMSEVEPDYTKKTYAECDRVQNQLNENLPKLGITPKFDHQGSVTNNTHIKLYSDIDLLVFETKFNYCQPPLMPAYPYKGNPLNDHIELRKKSEEILTAKYPAAEVDTSGGKSISLSGGSFYDRKIDVVPAVKRHTELLEATGNKIHLGITIYDIHTGQYVSNFPWLHNLKVDEKDLASGGKFKPLVRLIKSLRADADPVIKVSSYGICGLCYHLPNSDFHASTSDENLLARFIAYCQSIQSTGVYTQLDTPNGHTKLFDESSGIKVVEFNKLINEMSSFYKTL